MTDNPQWFSIASNLSAYAALLVAGWWVATKWLPEREKQHQIQLDKAHAISEKQAENFERNLTRVTETFSTAISEQRKDHISAQGQQRDGAIKVLGEQRADFKEWLVMNNTSIAKLTEVNQELARIITQHEAAVESRWAEQKAAEQKADQKQT